MEQQKLYTCIFALALASTSCGLMIGAFNIQIFGQKKSSDETLMAIIVKIIRRYDIILIQEIRDKTNSTMDKLMAALNSKGSTKFIQTTSQRLGSSVSTEQYSFLIRNDSGVSVVDSFQYQSQTVTFERPPFSVRLKSNKTAIKQFVLVALHSKPEEAVKEIGQLNEVHSTLKKKWNTDNILIMGDLNAGCAYASKKALNNLEIRKNPPYIWLIPDAVDTTTKHSECPYDRFIMTGAQFNMSLIAGSAQVFHFDKEFNLSPELTEAVSDHYPIELRLRNVATKSFYMENFSNAHILSTTGTNFFLALICISFIRY